ncbi:TetR/AcrR family transcriptional regulator [Aquipuribacter hungaricus]|uniref:TetR/AcrR family transcriptional regulator n=1 Tax=Aquipuribacter hungaricus TaxID=545624 RepID=A0ABV7WI84_9MICO
MPDPPSPSDTVRDAVVAVISEQGLEGTSVRRVAARAGVSIGAVQHHFPTKDAMLAGAMVRLEEVYRRRLDEEASQLPDRPDARLRATVRSLVPAEPDDRSDTALWLAFVARAAVHGPTAALHRETWQRAEDGIAWLVLACGALSEGDGTPAAPPPWARDAAAELLALMDGLAVSVLLEPGRMPPGRARRLADEAVDRVLDRAEAAAETRTP